MNTSAEDISKQLKDGSPWSAILRDLLSSMPEEKRGRMDLFAILKDLCDVKVETLLLVGGWNYWPGGSDDDNAIDDLLKGKISPKPAAR